MSVKTASKPKRKTKENKSVKVWFAVLLDRETWQVIKVYPTPFCSPEDLVHFIKNTIARPGAIWIDQKVTIDVDTSRPARSGIGISASYGDRGPVVAVPR